jgi:hypothetical protein
MQKPDLDRIYQIWITIDNPKGQILFNNALDTLKSQVSEVISILKKKKLITWYQFLIHGRKNDSNLYFHIRFSLRKGVTSKAFLDNLPKYCLYPEQIKRENVESINGVFKQLLNNEEIEQAWRIIGEQSEWIINLISIHKDGNIPIQHFVQFMHYYLNMMGLGNQAVLLLSPFFRF